MNGPAIQALLLTWLSTGGNLRSAQGAAVRSAADTSESMPALGIGLGFAGIICGALSNVLIKATGDVLTQTLMSYSLGVASVSTGENFKCGMDDIKAGPTENGDVCKPCDDSLIPSDYGYVAGDPIFRGLFPALSEGTMTSQKTVDGAACFCDEANDPRLKDAGYEGSLYEKFCDHCGQYAKNNKPAYCAGTVN